MTTICDPGSFEHPSPSPAGPARGAAVPTLLYASTIFLSAFLLFQVQPLLAKAILPWFGGSAAVWSTCLAFFQFVLLLGYVYANWARRRLTLGRQTLIHMALLAASALVLPLSPNLAWRPQHPGDPALRILGLLAATVGLPYFVLSTTGPLLQAWYADARPTRTPYRLYALSNAGSMIALITYPTLVEPAWGARTQALIWSASYLAFAGLCGWIAWTHRRADEGASTAATDEETAPTRRDRLLWVVLPACASILLLGVTSQLSQDVAPVPFLWVVPLALYLLSFVLCFERDWWYQRWVWLPLLPSALAGAAYCLYGNHEEWSLPPLVAAVGAAFFACCMFCHGELARLRPAPARLTSFYLMSTAGGAIGGIFVGLIAPRLFTGYFELPIGLLLCAVLALVVLAPAPVLHRGKASAYVAWPVMLVMVATLGWYLYRGVRGTASDSRVRTRNFYGVLRVYDDLTRSHRPVRYLLHGRISHGAQYLDPQGLHEPTTYYSVDTGIGRLLQDYAGRPPMRVGVLGLGAGTLAAYGRPGDYFRFYEINPLVNTLARTEFTFLSDSQATVDVIEGDARLSLEHEADQQFDVLAVDAFSGDSIPVHLVTREAFALYFRHMKPSGTVAIHVSNRYLELAPVVDQVARALGKTALLITTEDEQGDEMNSATSWMLVGNPDGPLRDDTLRQASVPLPKPTRPVRTWTDDHSSLWGALRE